MSTNPKRVAYLLAAYPGPRLSGDPQDYAGDYALYIRYHLAKLEKLEHNCDIILGINEPSNCPPGLDEFLKGLQVECFLKPNTGASYGIWNESFRRYPDYDYYILMEDDYVPVQDNFDKTLVDIAESTTAPYVCTMVGWGCGGGALPHAAISNGIVNGDVVRDVMSKGGFPTSPHRVDSFGNSCGQVTFSQRFLPYGNFEDFVDRYKAPYWDINNIKMYYDHNKEVLLAPQQWDIQQ